MAGASLAEHSVTIDLAAPARLTDVPALARQVARWWLDELVTLAPSWARRLLPSTERAASLFVQNGLWRLVSGDDEAPVLELDAAADDKGFADQILAAAPNFRLSGLTVVLPRTSALRRRITLPLMTDADLHGAVALQVDRLSPFKADAVRFAVKVTERDRVEGTLVADVVVVPRAEVDAIEGRLSALGLTPGAIDVADGEGRPAGFDLGRTRRSSPPRRALLTNLAFVLATLAAWYLAGWAWDMARTSEVERWQARIADLQPVAQRAATLRVQLEAVKQPFAIANAHRPQIPLNILSELTKVLPDTAHLTELRILGDNVDLTGFAANAPELIADIEASKYFADVKFRSPVTRRAELNKDRFEIALKLEGAASR